MKLVAIEEHILTREVADAWARLPPEHRDPGADLHSDAMEAQLSDMGDARLRRMDEAGVDVQVLSLTTPALQGLEPAQSVELARRTNDAIAAAVARHPQRFEGFAALPTPAPASCAPELERCMGRLGFKGALLCGRTRDKNLDHPDFEPMFEAAARLGAPLFIHPQAPRREVGEALYGGLSDQVSLAFSTFGLGWHYEAGVQFLRLVLAGVFDRHPALQVILGHWGEVVLFYLERIERMDRIAGLKRPIRGYLRENLYVTASGMFSDRYLQRTLEVVGPERLLFSTDYPYQYRPGREARGFLEVCALDAEDKARFAHGNWERLTGAGG